MTHDPLDELLRDAARSYRLPPDPPRELMWQRIHDARHAPVAVGVLSPRARWLRNAVGIAAVLLAGVVIGRATSAPARTDTGSVALTSANRTPSGGALPSVSQPLASGERRSADATSASSGADASIGADGPTPRIAVRAQSPAGDARSSYNVPRQGRGAVGDGTEMSAYRLAVVEHLARTEVLLTGFRAQSRDENIDARTAGQQFAVLSRELLQNTRLLLATHATDDPTLTRLLEDLELVLMQISQYAEEGRSGDLDAINQSLDRRNVLPKLRSTIPAGAPVPSGT